MLLWLLLLCECWGDIVRPATSLALFDFAFKAAAADDDDDDDDGDDDDERVLTIESIGGDPTGVVFEEESIIGILFGVEAAAFFLRFHFRGCERANRLEAYLYSHAS